MAEIESGTYRRGLTLGLTMAEIFMLLLFLLLLAFLVLSKEHEQVRVTLEERATLPSEVERLKRENVELEKENTITKNLLEESKQNLIEAEKSLENERRELPKEIQELVEQVESLENDLTVSKTEISKLREQVYEDEAQIESLESDLTTAKEESVNNAGQLEKIREENMELQKQLRYAKKGERPPCWYTVEVGKRKWHEMPEYLLDVAVHDGDNLVVRLNYKVPLPGYAIDENGLRAPTSYEEEYANLPLGDLMPGNEKSISLEDFEAFAKPMLNMGQNKEIRKYACLFYVKIWDLTSATSKEHYQHVRRKIQEFFGSYEVREDPW